VSERPNLTVRVPRGYFGRAGGAAKEGVASALLTPAAAKTTAPRVTETTEGALQSALTDAYSTNSLPTKLALTYLNTPNNGTVVTAAMQIATDILDYGDGGNRPADVDIAGVVLNDKGKITASFKNRLKIKPYISAASQPDTGGVIYNYRTGLTPGIYQVRVAARDANKQRVGSAMEWIQIPDLSTSRLTTSSLLIGGQVVERSKRDAGQPSEADSQVQFSVDHRFPRSGNLAFMLFIYNASRKGGAPSLPDLTAQVQILREGRPVTTTAQRRLNTVGMPDLDRISYAGNVPLNALGKGSYELRVTIADSAAKTSATQSVLFEVE
jgi:hypothetical protein